MGVDVNTICQGDCLTRLGEIDPGSVDLVFADPPFNIGYEYDVYDDRRTRQEYLAWSKSWISAVARVLKPTGTFWLAIGDEYAAELKLIAQDEVGLACRSWVIWYYTFGVNCVRGFSRSHTHLFHFVKDPQDFTFNADNPAIRVPSARQLVYGDLRANPKGRLPDNTWILRPQDAPNGAFGLKHDMWYFARVAGTFKEREGFHGCQMPEQLLGRIIRISSNPADLVLDPFGGSGTTLAVAKKLGRRWLGIELSPEYAKRIQERLAKTHVGDPLDGPEDAVRSAPKTSSGRSKVRLRKGRPMPLADEEVQAGIIAAYRETAQGHSTDYMLCDPELNFEFLAACKRHGVPGNAFVWNHLLLRIRKAGKLPRGKRSPKQVPFASMDSYSFASEIAMHLVGLDYGMKVDELLCNPEVAAELERLAEEFAPGHTSFEYRWAALAIRKRAYKAKQLAKTHFADWQNKTLAKPIPLSDVDADKLQGPAVYIVSNKSETLYVGEACDLKQRIENLRTAPGWATLEPTLLRHVPVPPADQSLLHGLQALLIFRSRPLLNSPLLCPRLDPAG